MSEMKEQIETVDAVEVPEGTLASQEKPSFTLETNVCLPCFSSTSQTKSCPAGHAFKHSLAPGGTCDGCSRTVAEGSFVSDCRECNYYLCTVCTPILQCPSGHELRTQAAIAGQCDGCNKKVPQGTLVVSCSTCNWYLCTTCQPLQQCPKGHTLKPWASQVNGQCDECGRATKQGDIVADCRDCNWFLCSTCHPQMPADARVQPNDEATAEPLPKCPKGHNAVPALARPGSCDQCGKKIRGGMVSECASCNWYMCAECHPIRQCKQGHKLEAAMAVPGNCDGCGKQVHENQSVFDCRRCNWYLCGACHMPIARSGA